MPGEFRHTAIALRGDQERGRRSHIALAVAAGLLLLAGLWSIAARIPVYAVSQAARLQARDGVHPVDALVSGRVTKVALRVGARVGKGDVLVALDDVDVTLRLDEARAKARGLSGQIDALEAEIAAREEALASTQSLGVATLSEARATRTETRAGADLAQRERERAEQMRREGLVGEAVADRAKVAMAQAQAAVEARDQRLSVLGSQSRRAIADRRAENEGLRRTLAELRAERDSAAAHAKRLEVERERHTVRAPIDGVLGQVRAPRVGSVVASGETVAVVTPDADLELVADFAPADVIGRVRPGQRARMRVTGFPWTQYGMPGARVVAVSSEVSDGRIRVVLQLDDPGADAIPFRHGLIGEVEIEIDEASPIILMARAAGRLFERGEPR